MPFNPNFTPIFDISEDVTHINVTYTMSSQSPLMTTETVWIVFTLLGIGLLLLSTRDSEDLWNDLCGVMAFGFLLVSTLQAWAVDTITGYGVTGLCEVMNANGVCTSHEFVLLENHMIYHYDLIGIVLAIITLISIANLVRLWLNYRRVKTEVAIDRRAMNPSMKGDRSESGKDEK